MVWIWNWNRNISKVGTGTQINLYKYGTVWFHNTGYINYLYMRRSFQGFINFTIVQPKLIL